MLRNPLVVVPILFKRLKEKNEEWRKVKKELNKEWKKTCSENITGSLDAKCFAYKREIEQSFTTERLLEVTPSDKSLFFLFVTLVNHVRFLIFTFFPRLVLSAQECHKAKSFAKHPSKIQRHPATNMIRKWRLAA